MGGPVPQRKTWDPTQDKRGLHCPKCWRRDLLVAYTRDRIGGKRRRRRCRNCGKEMWTMEEQPAA
jgi:DNA-directed RNA polymerase subunit RPC12/RpoP